MRELKKKLKIDRKKLEGMAIGSGLVMAVMAVFLASRLLFGYDPIKIIPISFCEYSVVGIVFSLLGLIFIILRVLKKIPNWTMSFFLSLVFFLYALIYF